MTVTQLGVSIAEASLESNVADLIFSLPIYWRAGNDYFVWPSSKSSKYEVEKEYKIFRRMILQTPLVGVCYLIFFPGNAEPQEPQVTVKN